ncbi:MAG: cupin domain-containing protein [Candidatus Aminicenantes bacterium]|jgi:quercetin dioxygenase-like cupin family protein
MFKIDKEDQPEVEMFEGAKRRTLACGRDVLMARFEYKKGAKVPLHKHSYEQVTTILEGSQKIVMKKNDEAEEIIIEAGDSYIIPANIEHEQISLEVSVTIDAWSLAP